MLLLYSRYGESNLLGGGRNQIVPPPDPIAREQILKDLHDLSDNEIPVQPELGGKFLVTAIRFASGFSGIETNKFWAAIEDGHVAYILQYSLVEQVDRKLEYQVSKVTEGTEWPPGATGETYVRTDQGFKLQK